jgi:hypothetical protein
MVTLADVPESENPLRAAGVLIDEESAVRGSAGDVNMRRFYVRLPRDKGEILAVCLPRERLLSLA